MLRSLSENEKKFLSDIIGPCLDRRTLGRFFYGEFDQLKEKDIKLHITWCKNCLTNYIGYLAELDEKTAQCFDEEYFRDIFDGRKEEKIVSLIHTLQCEDCLKKYIKMRGQNSELDNWEARLVESSDPIQRLTYLRSKIIQRLRTELF